MGEIIFVTGGARSGKSSFAENIFKNRNGKKLYIATATPFDSEMKERIKLHQIERGDNFSTLEKYKNIAEEVTHNYNDYNYILLDCITIMVNNIMFDSRGEEWDNITNEELFNIEKTVIKEIDDLINHFKNRNGQLVMVSNELGMGLVPEIALGRHFRDITGRVNQFIAKKADNVYLLVSGIDMKIK